MGGTTWSNFCLPTNTNKYYIFHKLFDSTFDICNSSFCYCLLLANDLLCRNIHHDMEWQQLPFFPLYLQHLFSFLFVDLWNCWQQSCLLLLDFQLTRMRNQEVFSLLYVEYSAALFVFSTISNHLLSQCPQGVKRFWYTTSWFLLICSIML